MRETRRGEGFGNIIVFGLIVAVFGVVHVVCLVARNSKPLVPEAVAATPAPKAEEPKKEEPTTKPERPPAPEDFQTFLFTIQVTMDTRRNPKDAAKQIKKLCGVIKGVAGTKKAIPAKLYGVYKVDEKVYCEPLPLEEKKNDG